MPTTCDKLHQNIIALDFCACFNLNSHIVKRLEGKRDGERARARELIFIVSYVYQPTSRQILLCYISGEKSNLPTHSSDIVADARNSIAKKKMMAYSYVRWYSIHTRTTCVNVCIFIFVCICTHMNGHQRQTVSTCRNTHTVREHRSILWWHQKTEIVLHPANWIQYWTTLRLGRLKN